VTVPQFANQVTAVFVVPVTVAVNCWVAPVARLAEDGVTLTATAGGEVLPVAALKVAICITQEPLDKFAVAL
jgi:hypothetical protein